MDRTTPTLATYPATPAAEHAAAVERLRQRIDPRRRISRTMAVP